MFARYVYNAGATQADILSDIIALVTGETNKANLSAACDQTNTEIFAAYYAAGWTLHDAAAGTKRQVVKSLCEDATYTKYVGIDLNTANAIYMGGAETWNETTHTGTNCIYAGGTTNVAALQMVHSGYFAPASGGTLVIYADKYSILIGGKTTGDLASMVGAVEFSRSGVNMALAGGYPCWGISNTYNYPYILVRPRAKNPTANGDVTGNTATVAALSQTLYNTSYIASAAFRRYSDEVPVYDALSIKDSVFVANASLTGPSTQYDYLGKALSDGYLSSAGVTFDEFVTGGKTYVRAGILNPYRGATSLCLFVPKG